MPGSLRTLTALHLSPSPTPSSVLSPRPPGADRRWFPGTPGFHISNLSLTQWALGGCFEPSRINQHRTSLPRRSKWREILFTEESAPPGAGTPDPPFHCLLGVSTGVMHSRPGVLKPELSRPPRSLPPGYRVPIFHDRNLDPRLYPLPFSTWI